MLNSGTQSKNINSEDEKICEVLYKKCDSRIKEKRNEGICLVSNIKEENLRFYEKNALKSVEFLVENSPDWPIVLYRFAMFNVKKNEIKRKKLEHVITLGQRQIDNSEEIKAIRNIDVNKLDFPPKMVIAFAANALGEISFKDLENPLKWITRNEAEGRITLEEAKRYIYKISLGWYEKSEEYWPQLPTSYFNKAKLQCVIGKFDEGFNSLLKMGKVFIENFENFSDRDRKKANEIRFETFCLNFDREWVKELLSKKEYGIKLLNSYVKVNRFSDNKEKVAEREEILKEKINNL